MESSKYKAVDLDVLDEAWSYGSAVPIHWAEKAAEIWNTYPAMASELRDIRAKLATAEEQAAHYKAAAYGLHGIINRMDADATNYHKLSEAKLAEAIANAEKAEAERDAISKRLELALLAGSKLRAERDPLAAQLESDRTRVAKARLDLQVQVSALVEQNERLRAALECIPLDLIAAVTFDDDIPTSIKFSAASLRQLRDALALTPPAALEELRRRERIATLRDVAFDLGRVHGEWQAAPIVAEMAEHLEQQLADAIRDVREKGGEE